MVELGAVGAVAAADQQLAEMPGAVARFHQAAIEPQHIGDGEEEHRHDRRIGCRSRTGSKWSPCSARRGPTMWPTTLTKPAAPIARPQPQGVPRPASMSMSSAKAVAVSAPRPEYPYEARRSKLTGSGVCIMTVDPSSGSVTSAEMSPSTGNAILDNAATSAFRRWRFKPGTVSKVRTPITFTMTGAQF